VPVIAIVGAGFSGSTLAANLLLRQSPGPCHVILIERGASFGRGVAYARREFPYLLNVPAGQMSADPSRPHDFLEFARTVLPDAREDQFLPRALYGDYLEHRLRTAEQARPANVGFTKLRASVRDVTPAGRGRWRLLLDTDESVVADHVVLACGNLPSLPIPGLADAVPPPVDPWHEPLRLDDCDSVLIVGTGLTMVDIALRIAAQERPVRIHAISRHGFLPQRQTNFPRHTATAASQWLMKLKGQSVRTICRELRVTAGTHWLQGGDWREVLTLVRNELPELWQSLSDAERSRFLRHLRPYWEVHRHRLPPDVMDRVQRLIDRQVLQIHAGRVLYAEPRGDRVRVIWSCRGGGSRGEVEVRRIVNCTGPGFDLHRSTDPLICSLRDRGLITADPLRLGVRTNRALQLIGAQGVPTPGLWYVGPMLRATYWEATAVPELRAHAAALSERLAAECEARRIVAQPMPA